MTDDELKQISHELEIDQTYTAVLGLIFYKHNNQYFIKKCKITDFFFFFFFFL